MYMTAAAARRNLLRKRLVCQVRARQQSSDATTAAIPPPPSPSSGLVVVSRRLWLAHLQKHAVNKKPAGPPPKDPLDDKPWPKSVVFGASVAAATLIPYFTTWWILYNPKLRETVFGDMDDSSSSSSSSSSSEWMKRLRHHFGEADFQSVSYVDRLNQTAAVDYRFPMEPSIHQRHAEAQIQKLLKQDVLVRISQIEGDAVLARQERTLPASLPANVHTLQKEIGSTDGYPVVTFPDPPRQAESEFYQEEETDQQADGLSSEETATTASARDPLLPFIQSFSPWHYINPATVPTSNKQQSSAETAARSMSTSSSHDDMEKSRLRYEIAHLENELQKGSTRAVDDILDDLNARKAELRKLSWKRWKFWN